MSTRWFLIPSFPCIAMTALSASTPAFLDWAPTPPMGWNSWDYYGTSITEEQTLAQAAAQARDLLPLGWDLLVVDIQWYEPRAAGHVYREGADLEMDAHGRLLPAPNRFPSSRNGAGFAPLAAKVQALGLRFGVHLMRGIPRQAVERNLPVLGSDAGAADIADRSSTCPWNPDMYGVDMARPGAQAYYDSVFALLASWGVDYVKVDDCSRPYHRAEIEAIRKAIDRSGRRMLLSLSPGETPLSAAPHVTAHANLWRVSDDFWDRWTALHEQFARLRKWNPHRKSGAWPDADMLPLGWLANGSRTTRFTREEQVTLMTLWCIARSPLMHGGDMTRTDPFTLSLLTNPEVLAVNQASANNRPLFERDGLIAWIAEVPGSPDRYLALFNARDPLHISPGNARHAGGVLNAESPTEDISVDLSGGTRLVLQAGLADENSANARIHWESPCIVTADGRRLELVSQSWIRTDATWDSTRATGAGITALTPMFVEYPLPADAVRFTARARFERDGSMPARAALRCLVVVETPGMRDTRTGMEVAVDLNAIGMPGEVVVRDLWSHTDAGTISGTFAPVIPWHGAGLYRLSPR